MLSVAMSRIKILPSPASSTSLPPAENLVSFKTPSFASAAMLRPPIVRRGSAGPFRRLALRHIDHDRAGEMPFERHTDHLHERLDLTDLDAVEVDLDVTIFSLLFVLAVDLTAEPFEGEGDVLVPDEKR